MRLSFPTTAIIFIAVIWLKAIMPTSSGIPDTDFFWHIAYGQWMLEHGTLPAVAPFSWTMVNEPYRMTQWLGELIMGIFFNAWGQHGTKAIGVFLTAVTIGFSWAGASRFIKSPAALGISLLCGLVFIALPMRPQIFTFALLAVVSWIAAEWMTNGKRWTVWLLPLIMALWVNLHGGYVIGLVLVALVCAGEWYESWKGGLRFSSPPLVLSGAAIFSLLATLLNPYGVGAWESVFMISGLKSSSVISEWQPITVVSNVGWLYLLILVPYMTFLVAGARPRMAHAAIATFFLLFGLLANRQMPICAAVMAPPIAALFAGTKQYELMTAGLMNRSRPVIYAIATLVMIASFSTIQQFGDDRMEEAIKRTYPVVAVEFMKSHGFTERVYCDNREASYLIFAGIPVSIDGRLDLYGDRHFFEHYLAARAAPGWDVYLAKLAPSTILVRNEVSLRQAALASRDWKLVYEDEFYSVLRPASDSMPSLEPRRIEYLGPDGELLQSYRP